MLKKMETRSIHLYSEVKTDIGAFRIACSPRGITSISPASEAAAAFETAYEKRIGTRPRKGNIPAVYRQAFCEALKGAPTPPGLIDWTFFTGFQQAVLKRLLKVRAGTVRTYSWLAGQAGRPNAARAVGSVMARNPIPLLLPCHRIVPAAGGIGNYGLGKELKRELLEREGYF
jgi:methylated-DNA-[protein]-cysteine S-methyltransferase